MKKKNSGQLHIINKNQIFPREKISQELKEIGEINTNFSSQKSLPNNYKDKNIKKNNITVSTKPFLIRKRSELKLKKENIFDIKNKEKERKRVFSISPKKKEKLIDNIDLKENKEDNINVNINPELCVFDLYKHIKENLRNKDKLCKDKLTKESYYCIDCKMSTCKRCLNFNIHKGHNLIPKYLYYYNNETIFSKSFEPIDSILKNEDNNYILNNQKLKENLKNIVKNGIDNQINRLNEIKIKKINEIEKLFENTDDCIKDLKENENKIKEEIKNFLNNQNDFYNLQIEEEISTKASSERNGNNQDFEILKNKLEEINENQNNKDRYNTIFLTNYDLFKNIEFINEEIKNLIEDIEKNKNRYLTCFNENIKKFDLITEEFNKDFKGVFNYRFLTNDFYKKIFDKINKFSEKINQMKKYIFETVNRDGSFEKIMDDNNSNEIKIKQRFDNILNYQLDEKEGHESLSTSKYTNSNSNKLSSYINSGLSQKMKIISKINKLKNIGDKNNNQIYKKLEDIKLDNPLLQDFFSYETFNTVHDFFKYKKKKNTNGINSEDNLDKEIFIAKPIPGSPEIELYDKKSSTLIKKMIKFEKNKHKFMNFLHGCRSVLIKDMLYILGGVDQDKNSTKMAYVYYIKTNELKLMREMLCPHAYHSIDFLDYYKSIIVIGGENSKCCELYDLNIGLWRRLPDLNIPRALCNLYLDKINHALYTIFGVVGNITKKNNFIDVIEVLELKRLSIGWNKIEYENKAEMDFKSGYNKILPLNREMILIYGATNMRDFVKKAAVYLIFKNQIVKIDNGIFKEIKENSKTNKKLEQILSSYI